MTIILPNLASVVAGDKCLMPSPPAVKETVSHFKCQNMLLETLKTFKIDKPKSWRDIIFSMKDKPGASINK